MYLPIHKGTVHDTEYAGIYALIVNWKVRIEHAEGQD